MTVNARGCTAALIGLLAVTPSVRAQTVQRGVEVNIDAFGGWNLSTEQTAPVDVGGLEPAGVNDSFVGFNGRAEVEKASRSLEFAANGSASIRSLDGVKEWADAGFSGGVSLGSLRTRRLTWRVMQSVTYAPINALSFYPTPGAAPIADFRLASERQFSSDTGALVTYGLSRASELSFSATLGALEAPDGSDSMLTRWTVNGRYTHRAGRYARIYGGYGVSLSTLPTASTPPPTEDGTPAPAVMRTTLHNIDAGVDYARSLSISRRTSLGFRTGSTAFRDSSNNLQFDVIGSAGLTHQIGRTWDASVMYERSVRFVPAFADPFVGSGVSGQLNGRLTRRTAVRIAANWMKGRVGVEGGDNRADSSSVSAQYRWGLSPRLAFFAEYFLFRTALGSDIVLPGALPNDAKSHAIRVGLSLGTTLLGIRR